MPQQDRHRQPIVEYPIAASASHQPIDQSTPTNPKKVIVAFSPISRNESVVVVKVRTSSAIL